jgi:hypothetical protein
MKNVERSAMRVRMRLLASIVTVGALRVEAGSLAERNRDCIKPYRADPRYWQYRQKYVLYFTDGGSVRLDLRGHKGAWQLRWVDITRGTWGDSVNVKGDAFRQITAPQAGGWVAVLTKPKP